jgi:hypothetical protein
MPDDRDRPPSDLARGPAKPSDIERTRRDLDEAETRVVRAEEASVARHRERLAIRTAQHEEDARR